MWFSCKVHVNACLWLGSHLKGTSDPTLNSEPGQCYAVTSELTHVSRSEKRDTYTRNFRNFRTVAMQPYIAGSPRNSIGRNCYHSTSCIPNFISFLPCMAAQQPFDFMRTFENCEREVVPFLKSAHICSYSQNRRRKMRRRSREREEAEEVAEEEVVEEGIEEEEEKQDEGEEEEERIKEKEPACPL